ncbi:UDP-glucosyltransferase 2-like [Schistocerca piceifrons]|uniref:UDP-glucosyltransferase 2-like n=1 Tax=Schistocerca piceifrons TaxID=274613 RepID=UPI001F5F7F72|nr:UDP-glucosyltransferase 2-like [Schistocerca piceifrons]
MKKELALCLFLMIAGRSFCARILGIVPTPAHSHQIPFLAIMRALAERGHQVTVITTDPLKDPPKNFTQIDLSFTKTTTDIPKLVMEIGQAGPVGGMEVLLPLTETLCKLNFELPQIKKLLELQEKFDLVVLETFMLWCYFGFVHKLGSPPIVGFLSAGLTEATSSFLANPINPAYMPALASAYTDHMDFWQRMDNAQLTLRLLHSFHNVIVPFQDRLIQEHFGADMPSLSVMLRNMSLMITGNDFVLGYPQPMVPGIVHTTGLHISNERKPLPKDIQQFLDGAEEGFIFFSLGSNIKSSNLPETMRNNLMKAFAQIPQRVLWKFELDNLPGKPDNVMISKWLPQRDILAHRNIRLFFTHGGLLSFSEAAYFGVPLLAMPVFGDQRYNVAKMTSAGVGEKIEFGELTTDSVLRAIRHIIENPSYQENMKRLSAVYREHQSTSLERAVWWVEYVIRHQGAPHLRSAALDLHWWQLLLLDVIAFILAVAAVAAFLLFKVVQFCARALGRSKQKKD